LAAARVEAGPEDSGVKRSEHMSGLPVLVWSDYI